MSNIKKSELKHGDSVTFELRDKHIKDAKVSRTVTNMHLCHNDPDCDGDRAPDRLGYRYSWSIGSTSSEYAGVTNLQLVEQTMDTLKHGVILVDDEGCEAKVLGVCDEVIFLSGRDNFEKVYGEYTPTELKAWGWKIKEAEAKEDKSKPKEVI